MNDNVVLSKDEYENFVALTVRYKIILDRLLAMDVKLNVDPSINEYYEPYFKAIETIKRER